MAKIHETNKINTDIIKIIHYNLLFTSLKKPKASTKKRLRLLDICQINFTPTRSLQKVSVTYHSKHDSP